MKIKKLIKILECIEGNTEGKLPNDVYHLGTYIRENDSCVDIKEMDFVHVMRAFKRAINYDKQLEVSVSQVNQITKLEQEVSRLREKNGYLKERIEELIPIKAYPKYDFCEIPNDRYGNAFVTAVKKYLNTNKYKVRVRGQHIKEELKGKGLTSYGQSIDESTHLRVYIEEK